MQAFKNFTAMVAPLDRAHVDTDQIIPKQFLKAVVRTGLKTGLFFDWRSNPDGTLNKDFELNKPRFQGASILVTRGNFGCGSSREHAVWALRDYGFRAVIAASFADIFSTNCVKNELVPVVLSPAEIAEIMPRAVAGSFSLKIDLEQCTVSAQGGFSSRFEMDPFQRSCLLEGTDEIGVTLKYLKQIEAYEKGRRTYLNHAP